MKKKLYLVRQRRACWVSFVQEIEASSEKEAEDIFYNEFDPQVRLQEEQLQRYEYGPLTVFRRQEFTTLEACAHESD